AAGSRLRRRPISAARVARRRRRAAPQHGARRDGLREDRLALAARMPGDRVARACSRRAQPLSSARSMSAPTSTPKFGSRIGFILAAAGSAIGLGNIWRFPYTAGESGGAAFVLVYFFFVLLVGVPV